MQKRRGEESPYSGACAHFHLWMCRGGTCAADLRMPFAKSTMLEAEKAPFITAYLPKGERGRHARSTSVKSGIPPAPAEYGNASIPGYDPLSHLFFAGLIATIAGYPKPRPILLSSSSFSPPTTHINLKVRPSFLRASRIWARRAFLPDKRRSDRGEGWEISIVIQVRVWVISQGTRCSLLDQEGCPSRGNSSQVHS